MPLGKPSRMLWRKKNRVLATTKKARLQMKQGRTGKGACATNRHALPGWEALFAGNPRVAAESRVHPQRGPPILALGTGNRPGPTSEAGPTAAERATWATWVTRAT